MYMKSFRLIFTALLVCSLALSCAKTEVDGAVDNGTPEEAPAPVEFSTNLNVNAVASTKAGIDAWASQKLYIYAFPTNTIPAASSDSILIKNAVAIAPLSGGSTAQSINVYKEGTTLYYYTADKTTYDFFAYFVADGYAGYPNAPVPTINAKTNVTLPIVLNGTQDIMLATTDKEADVVGKGVAPSSAYSAYSARKEVIPNLVFQHQLSRFVFRIIAGNDDGTKIKIEKVTLESPSKADLRIANIGSAAGIANPTDTKAFELTKKDGGAEITAFKPKLKVSKEFDDDDQIGESIMVIPGKEHKLVIEMQQYGDDSRTTPVADPFKYEYVLKTSMVSDMTGDTFLAGYQYNVNVVVYGREKVLVNVTLTPWGTGGTITIDNDTEWGDEPRFGVKTTTGVYLYFYGDIAPGTVVKVWDKVKNTMIPAPVGDYVFESAQGTITGVTLETVGDETKVKTVATT